LRALFIPLLEAQRRAPHLLVEGDGILETGAMMFLGGEDLLYAQHRTSGHLL